MINTRSQANREGRIEQTELERFADDDDNVSVSDHFLGRYFNEIYEETMRSLERKHDKYRIEQRFLEMNKQIRE